MRHLGLRTPALLAGAVLLLGLSACDSGNRGGGGGGGSSAPADTLALTGSNRLVSFSRTAPGSLETDLEITGLDDFETLEGIDIRPSDGKLYAVGSTGRIYTLDTVTGVATPGASLDVELDGDAFGVDFNPVPDRLRIVSDTGQNLRVNVDTGAVTVDGPLTVGGTAATDVTAAAYTNSFGAACRTALFYLNTSTGGLFTTSSPNEGILTAVGTPNAPSGPMSAFEIATLANGSNTAFAVLDLAAGPTLAQLDLASGAIVGGGLIGGSDLTDETITGLAIAPPATAPAQAVGGVLGLTTGNRIVSFNQASPAKLCTSAAITNIPAMQNLLGIDLRPSNGLVYGLTSGGALMTINPVTGVGSTPLALVADPDDASPTPNNAAFTALDGASFGLDFNPVPDRLRVVSNTGQNLRINVENGRVTTDGTLSNTLAGAARTGITAAAYTNSIAGGNAATLGTTLYYLDSSTDQLLSTAAPNDGVVGPPSTGLTVVENFGFDANATNGFDIDGRNNTALIAVNVAAETGTSLRTLDLLTGAASASLGTVGGGEALRGLAFNIAPTATVFAVTDAGALISFAPGTPATISAIGNVSGLQGGETILGMDFRPATGALTAVTDAERLYSINTTTGAATPGASLVADPNDASPTPNNAPYTAPDGTAFGVDFNPVPDRLRTVSDAGQNLRINVGTGATISDGALSYGPAGAWGAAYTNSFAGATATQLYVIDSTADRLFLQDPPNNGVLKDRGPLGVDAGTVIGFEIVGENTAFAALAVGGVTGLYRIDLSAFAAKRATLVGPIGAAGTTIKALSAVPAAVAPANPTLFALTRSGGNDVLVSFASSAPQTLTIRGTVSGLTAGDVILGMDFRPATGVLFALAQTGRLYTLNVATGAATLLSTLAAAPIALDPTPDFASLTGASFGVDFNPVPDRLRVVSDAGQNLRINVDNGATITDANLNRPAQAAAAAYTNSFAGALATTLYVLDPNSPGLSTVAPPNDGTLLPVNGLGLNLANTTALGFDIAGGGNGFSLAALVAEGQTQSNLYRINLTTGQATLVGPIGPAATIVEAMAVRVQ